MPSMTNPQDLTNKLFLIYNEDGTKRIADNTLVALTLLIAESRTEKKTPWSKSSSTSSIRITEGFQYFDKSVYKFFIN